MGVSMIFSSSSRSVLIAVQRHRFDIVQRKKS
jgi:hypothetical protein